MHWRSAKLRFVIQAGVALGACALAACGDGESEERLSLSFTSSAPVSIDAHCPDACIASARLRVAYPDDFFAASDAIDLVAYRVDYDFGGELGEVPFYAHPIDVRLVPGETEDVQLVLAGRRQHAFFAERAGERDAPLRGRAIVQLAGYDWDDEQLFVYTEVDVDVE